MTPQRFVMPDVVTTHFHLRPGDKVGDFGAGGGYFTNALSQAVGHEGKVFAIEIQRNLADTLTNKVRQEHLGNVEVVWGDFEEEGACNIADDVLDAAMVVNSLFQTDDKKAALKEIARTLRGGGKLFIIDWSESWGGLGPQPNNVLSEDEARSVAESLGLTFERSFDAGDHHYGLAFRKS